MKYTNQEIESMALSIVSGHLFIDELDVTSLIVGSIENDYTGVSNIIWGLRDIAWPNLIRDLVRIQT